MDVGAIKAPDSGQQPRKRPEVAESHCSRVALQGTIGCRCRQLAIGTYYPVTCSDLHAKVGR